MGRDGKQGALGYGRLAPSGTLSQCVLRADPNRLPEHTGGQPPSPYATHMGGTGSAASCPGHRSGAKAWASRCTEPAQWANETPELHVGCRQDRGSGWPPSPKADSAGCDTDGSCAPPLRLGLRRLMACQSGLDGTETTMRGGKNALASGDRRALNPKGTAVLHGVLVTREFSAL